MRGINCVDARHKDVSFRVKEEHHEHSLIGKSPFYDAQDTLWKLSDQDR